LDDVLCKYKCVLADNSAIFNYEGLNLRESPISTQERIKKAEEDYESLDFFREELESGKMIHTTNLILEEFISFHYSYKERLKKYSRRTDGNAVELLRKWKNLNELKGKIYGLFFEKGRLILLDENESRIEKHFHRKYSALFQDSGLSWADRDLFLKATAVRESRGPSAIISNDYGIISTWHVFLKCERLTPSDFGFFTRAEFDVFISVEHK